MDRKDKWTAEDDSFLAETVLRHIQSGSSQLMAFEQASARLNRTSAACGFRWNSELRKHYEDAIRKAKQERLLNKKGQAPAPAQPDIVLSRDASEPSQSDESPLRAVSQYIEELEEKVKLQQSEIARLKEKLHQERPELLVSEDLHHLMKILKHARDLGFLEKAN